MLWLCEAGQPPRPLASVPFDPDKFDRAEAQTDRLLREARRTAATRSSRAVGGGGRARGDESDLQSVWEERAAMNAGRGPASWARPAQALGLTQAAAQRIYNRSPAEARDLFRSAEPGRPAIGRRDSWDVWFAAPRDVAAVWDAPKPTRPASAPLHTDRTVSRIERLRAQVQEVQS